MLVDFGTALDVEGPVEEYTQQVDDALDAEDGGVRCRRGGELGRSDRRARWEIEDAIDGPLPGGVRRLSRSGAAKVLLLRSGSPPRCGSAGIRRVVGHPVGRRRLPLWPRRK